MYVTIFLHVYKSVFQELTNLTTLDLKNNHLTTFPVELSACPCLSTVDLTKNQIQVFGLKKPYVTFSIRDLTLISNGLREFPNYLYKIMPHLEKLKLSKNNLDGVLDSPLHLPELRNLDLSHNSVKVIGDKFFTNCIKLETFAIANNGLETLPSEDISKSLARLYQLRLNKNNLYGKEPFYVPKFVLELPSLRLIELCDNGLIGFPAPSVWKSPILKEVIFSRNLISKLNLEGAKAWSKLEKLHISHNRLSELPREIGQLISLQSFDFSHNKTLTTLPDELGKCSRLWEMPTDGCNIDLADSLLKGRVRDLIIYLHNRLKKAQRYFCMKLMVVGYGGRGKTTLLRALCKKYKKSAEDRPTVGVIVNDWKYERHKFGKNCAYTIRTWDFAGQEDFYSTHQCFLSNRAVYLIVYDVSRGVSEIDRLQPWLSNILARAPACPVIVVGTHYDRLNPDEYGKVQEIEEKLHVLSNKPGYPVILLRAMVDCSKETPEMEELRRRVKDIIDNFKVKGKPVMGQKVPASYVKLSELLSEEAKNPESNLPVLRRNQLLKLVQNAGLDLDEEELDQAVWFLHETGVLLHYNESALQLRDFYFINPGWLCRMMAQVVTVPQINPFISPQGIMKKDSAKWLFTGKTVGDETHFKFPHHLIPQYLRLLEKFEIALPRNNDELMIPCRLPAERPVLKINVHALPKDDKISRIYVMPSAPIGFWSRLITRLVVFSHSSVAEILLQLSVEPIVQYWREGIFVAWPKYAYFLVDSCKDNDEELHITVPSTTFGYRLLGYLVDHVDALVDEWYPGLTGIDPVLGRELLQKFAQCYRCTEKPKRFLVSEIIIQSETSDEIFCPKHKGNIELGHLAPDVMLTDLESHFQLDMNEFEFKDSPENLLGDGGFGSVFKAVYKKQIVAAKVFGAVGDDHPHKMLRQEVNILRRLNHPNVLSLTAVGLRPARLVLLEFAPVGSLGNVLRNRQPLSRILQHKIASQICEGMCYLHRLMVVYRDMKPDNVLIFNLSSSAKINAKISDYGISRFSTLYGLTAQEGTPAYRAPEVIKGETYSFQADVFSFGITLYVMVTGGQHPYDELEFQSEKDKAFAENLPIPPITKRGIKPWPDMQEVINQCLQQVPDYRPQSQEVCRKLRSAELYCLREFRPISVGTTVECMAYQPIDEEETKLWIASGDNDYMQFGWFNLLDYRDEFKGAMFPYGRILCMLPVDTEHILLGTQMGRIFVFDTVTREINHSTEVLSDSVLSLHLVQRADDNNVIFAGLANGRLAFFPVSEILQVHFNLI
ncbi:hypothetical protein SNE40_015467 [Patella caerulea]|uniref:non-specific serine/threonine protein kinase n=1 Tax=Patella caerulea TaxID=87958 RepID=A0AAN8JK00_PATCE